MSKRQNWYSAHWPTRVYTPQAVVDGEQEVVGGDGRSVVQLIRQAAKKRKGTVEIAHALNAGGGGFRLQATGLTQGETARVMLAIVEDDLESDVQKGENAGRTLQHAGVVRALVEAGKTSGDEAAWSGSVSVPFAEDWNRANLRAVAFVQEAGSRAILAIGVQDLQE
jgi:hypothetical protein